MTKTAVAQLLTRASRSAVEQQFPLPLVARQLRRALELGARLAEPPQLLQEIAAHARQEMIGLEHRLRRQRIDDLEPGLGPEQHGEGDGAVELDDRRRRDLAERAVESDDARPVGLLRVARPRVAG